MSNSSSNKSGMGNVTPPNRGEPQRITIMECGAAIGQSQMESFVNSFQQSARRWEVVVYPAMFAFIILASYGFFLIYSLTSDMSTIANRMDPDMGGHMSAMADHVTKISVEIKTMTNTIQKISGQLDTLTPILAHMNNMDKSITRMNAAIEPMNVSISSMNSSISQMTQSISHLDSSVQEMERSTTNMDTTMTGMTRSIHLMASNTDQMRIDLSLMGQSTVSRPMSFMNNAFPMPW